MDGHSFRTQAKATEETKRSSIGPSQEIERLNASQRYAILAPRRPIASMNQDSSTNEKRLNDLYMTEMQFRSQLHRLNKLRNEVEYRNVFGGAQVNPYYPALHIPSLAVRGQNSAASDLYDTPILPETLTGATAFPPGSNAPEHLLVLRRRIAHEEKLIGMMLEERERRENLRVSQSQVSLGPQVKEAREFLKASKPREKESKDAEWTMPVTIDVDKYVVSPYQQMLRDSLEFFVLQGYDQLSNSHGRDDKVKKGQVGIRCRFCKNRPFHWRGRGSVYFPGKAVGVYQAAQNIGTNHLLCSCSDIPADRREEMSVLRDTAVRRYGGGKRYWEECCRSVGIYDQKDKPGLWLKSPAQGMQPGDNKRQRQKQF